MIYSRIMSSLMQFHFISYYFEGRIRYVLSRIYYKNKMHSIGKKILLMLLI